MINIILVVCNNQYDEEEHAIYNTETRDLLVVDSHHSSISGILEGFDFIGIDYVELDMVSEKNFKEELYGEDTGYFCDIEQSELEKKILKRYKKIKKKDGVV